MTQALLLITEQCPHCHTMEKLLKERVNDGAITGLDVIHVEHAPELVKENAVRSVPWFKLGGFTFDKALSKKEIDFWLSACTEDSGRTEYIAWLLSNGKLQDAIRYLVEGRAQLSDLIPLLSNPEAKMNVRIGMGAILERFENTPQIRDVTTQLIELLEHQDYGIRTDACHYLSLTHSVEAIEPLKRMLLDEFTDVREVASESLDSLKEWLTT